jgi:hypothetical protein
VAAAVYEGLRSDRWGKSEDLVEAAKRLENVPAEFGDWTSETVEMDEKVLRVAEAAGHVSRIYKNRKNRAEVSVLLLCGRTGPIGAHTPDVCYAGSGYEMVGQPEKKTLPFGTNSAATYWSVRFEKKSLDAIPQRVCWMWGNDGDWQAATNPRSEFALKKSLYKLYVTRGETNLLPTRDTQPDPIQEFLKDFLPEVKTALAKPATSDKK